MSSLANYENGMRRGQGFNSYTQGICIDDAVLIRPAGTPAKDDSKLLNGTTGAKTDGPGNSESNGTAHLKTDGASDLGTDGAATADAGEHSSVPPPVPSPPGVNVDQIVTYSSRSIDNMSDIMDALNISSSASIKYGTVKGSGSASFVNENKVNDSDLNFIVTVKVTNSSPVRSDTMEFNPIPGMKPEDFPGVYGDCFIADFLEGGEFSAIISIKVQSKSNVSKVKLAAELEMAVGPPGLSVGAKDEYSKDKSDVWKDTETTISVNWSGGGDVKPPGTNWDLTSVVKAANEFPNKVATCSQRTSAILMKYTSLRSFQTWNDKLDKPCKVLDYSCCDLYTVDLFSAYMAYKSMWKRISDMMKQSRSYKALEKTKDIPDPIQTDPASLNMARRECRKALTQILEETKLLATKPELAGLDEKGNLRDSQHLFPAVLGRRLPRFVGNVLEDEDGLFKDFTGEELAVIGQHVFNPDLQFSDLVGNENPVKGKESHIFCSLHVNPTDKLDFLTNVRIHAHQHHMSDHFRAFSPNFSNFSKESERAISGISFNTSRDQTNGQDPRAKVQCKCGLLHHVGRRDHEKEDVDDKFLSRPASVGPDSSGIAKAIVGFVPGTFRIAALTLFTADGMKVCEWNMYGDLKMEKRPRLEQKVLTPPEEEAEESGKKVVKWVLVGFWGRADLVVERLGAVWRRI